jgi:hypothetical protein
MHRSVISPYTILVAHEGTYGDQKRSIAYSLEAEGGGAFCHLKGSSATIGLFSPPLLFSLPSLVHVQSFDKFNYVLQFVFVLDLVLILLISIFFFIFNAFLSLFYF